MYEVIAKLKNHNPVVEGTQIKVEPFWIAKRYKSLARATVWVNNQRNNPTYRFEIQPR